MAQLYITIIYSTVIGQFGNSQSKFLKPRITSQKYIATELHQEIYNFIIHIMLHHYLFLCFDVYFCQGCFSGVQLKALTVSNVLCAMFYVQLSRAFPIDFLFELLSTVFSLVSSMCFHPGNLDCILTRPHSDLFCLQPERQHYDTEWQLIWMSLALST